VPVQVAYICALLLIVGAAPLPYGYYTLLRIVACGVFGYGSYIAFKRRTALLPYLLALLAILFNPLVPIYLSKAIWIYIDISAGIFLLAVSRRLLMKPSDRFQ
jgi:hypothetical protein